MWFAPVQELLEKKILKTGPYRPDGGSGRDAQRNGPILCERDDIRRDWKNETHLFKTPPYILGYTGKRIVRTVSAMYRSMFFDFITS